MEDDCNAIHEDGTCLLLPETSSSSSSSSVGEIRHGLTTSADGAGITLTYQHTITDDANRIVIVSAGFEHDSIGEQITGVTYDGVAMTFINEIAIDSGGFSNCISLWYIDDANLPSAGTYDVVVTASLAPDRNIMSGCSSYFGVDQQNPIQDESTNSNLTTDTISTDVTTIYENSYIVSAVQCGNGGTYAPDSTGAVERYEVVEASAASSTQAAGELDVFSPGLTSISWTYSTGANRQVIAAAVLNPEFPV